MPIDIEPGYRIETGPVISMLRNIDYGEAFNLTNRHLNEIDKDLIGLPRMIVRYLAKTRPLPLKILDVAGGRTSQLTLELSSDPELGAYSDVTNVDLVVADQDFSPNARSRHGNALSLDFPSHNFDLILSYEFLPWLSGKNNFERPIQAYLEMARVLKPGGVALVFDRIFCQFINDSLPRYQWVGDLLRKRQVEFLPEEMANLVMLAKHPVSRELKTYLDEWQRKHV